jgi:hypothetical protein
MSDPVGYVLAIGVLLAILALAAIITLGNERVRRATLDVRDVAHAYALGDLAMRREQARRTFSFANQAESLQALEQIALDAAKCRYELLSLSVAPGAIAALLTVSREGETCIFTPSADSFLKAHPAYIRRVSERHLISGLNGSPFVIEELEAVAHGLGLTALPRTEEWVLLIAAPEDYSLLPRSGWPGWVRRVRR